MLIDVAANGEDAVRMASTKKYDLVLMDMQMPVMDGVTATKAIRSKPQLSNLPIIAMTANVMAADREKCIEAGMNDHVAKPIDPDELFTVMLRWIKPRRRQQPDARARSTGGKCFHGGGESSRDGIAGDPWDRHEGSVEESRGQPEAL